MIAATPPYQGNGDSARSNPPKPKERKPQRRFKVLTDKDIEELSDPEWTVEGVLPSRSFGLLYGQAGVGKTFVALDIGFSIATADEWCGHEVTPGAVVYVIAEGVTGLKQRVRAWKDAHGFDQVERMYFVTEGVQLTDRSEVSLFVRDLREQIQEPISLVILDTMARCFVGGDENSAKDVGVLVDAAERMRKELDTAVILVHHTTKKGGAERGSSALRGALDTMLSLRSASGVLTVECEKQKDGEAFKPIQLRLTPVLNSCIVEPISDDAINSKVLDCLRVLVRISAEGDVKCGDWLEASDTPQSSFHRYRKELVRRGLVAKGPNGKYSVTEKDREPVAPTLNKQVSTHE